MPLSGNLALSAYCVSGPARFSQLLSHELISVVPVSGFSFYLHPLCWEGGRLWRLKIGSETGTQQEVIGGEKQKLVRLRGKLEERKWSGRQRRKSK